MPLQQRLRRLAGMARPLRIEFPGAVYHVTSRGDRREAIYRDDEDRLAHLAVIGAAMERHDASALAWCLMGNHYHLLVRTRRANLSRLMRHVNGVYTQRHNLRHGLVGHLFQGRYTAILVDSDAYLLTLCRYVERNPVAAGLVAHAQSWRWSSCRSHLGVAEAPPWLDIDAAFEQLLGRPLTSSVDGAQARQRYAQWLCAQPAATQAFSWQAALQQQIYLGNADFVERMQAHAIPARRTAPEVPRPQRQAPRGLAECLARTNERGAAIWMAHREAGMTLTAIAQGLGLSVSRVSRLLAAHEDRKGAMAAADWLGAKGKT